MVGKRLLDLGLPKSSYVVLIARNGGSFVPDGSTVIEAGDSLLVFANQPTSIRLRSMFHARHLDMAENEVSSDQQGGAAS